MGRLTDIYLLLLVIAGMVMLNIEPWAMDGTGNRLVGFVVLLALTGWYASLGGAHKNLKFGVRIAAVGISTVLIGALGFSLATG
jgi:hypothetical protein